MNAAFFELRSYASPDTPKLRSLPWPPSRQPARPAPAPQGCTPAPRRPGSCRACARQTQLSAARSAICLAQSLALRLAGVAHLPAGYFPNRRAYARARREPGRSQSRAHGRPNDRATGSAHGAGGRRRALLRPRALQFRMIRASPAHPARAGHRPPNQSQRPRWLLVGRPAFPRQRQQLRLLRLRQPRPLSKKEPPGHHRCGRVGGRHRAPAERPRGAHRRAYEKARGPVKKPAQRGTAHRAQTGSRAGAQPMRPRATRDPASNKIHRLIVPARSRQTRRRRSNAPLGVCLETLRSCPWDCEKHEAADVVTRATAGRPEKE